jgi:hypothetical protein
VSGNHTPWATAWQLSYTGDEWHFAREASFSPSDIERGIVRNITPLNPSSQAEIERLRDILQSIKTHGYLANIPVDQGWGSSGKKPASKDVWCFPRHMLDDLDAALSGGKP